jgi:hypothetical protein
MARATFEAGSTGEFAMTLHRARSFTFTFATLTALAAGACGVADSDPTFWTQSKDLGGTQFQLPSSTGSAGASDGAGGAGGAPTTGAAGQTAPGTGNEPGEGAGGFVGGGSGGVFPQETGGFDTGAGGFDTGAGGMFGAGGVTTSGSGGTTNGAGGQTNPTGNSGKCTFTFDVTTVTANGRYAPRNVGAIWITDSANKFVKTLQLWGTIRLSNATAWTQSSASNRVDAVSGATRSGHGALSAKWDCTDVSENAVMDGQYSANVTFAESDANPFFGGTAIQTSVKFPKGPGGADTSGTDAANFKSMHVALKIP